MNKLLSVLAAGLLATSSVVLRKYSPTAQLRRFEGLG